MRYPLRKSLLNRVTPSRIVFNIFNYTLLTIFSLLCILPVWHVIMASFSDPRALLGNTGLVLYPLGTPSVAGYEIVFANDAIWRGYLNTIFYVLFTAVVGTVLTAMAGYICSRSNFKFAKPITLFILFTMVFSGGTIPTYMVVRNLGMLNTVWSVLIPGIMNAYYVIIMKSAFEQLPASYEEAAKLDGATPMTIMIRILVPLVKPTLAVIVMFAVIGQWNSWYPASIYMPMRSDLWPLQLIMQDIMIVGNTGSVDGGSAADTFALANLMKYCIVVVATLPILVAYPFAQKYFVKGMTLGGVKE